MALLLGKKLLDIDEDVMDRVDGCLWSCWVGGRDAKNKWVGRS